MSQNNDVSTNQNDQAFQAPVHHDFVQPRPIFNRVHEPSFNMGQNLPPQGYNVDYNRAVIPSARVRGSRASYPRGRMARSFLAGSSHSHSVGEATANGCMENHQYPNPPLSTDPTRNPQITSIYNNPYDPRYAQNGLPVDPFLRLIKLNPNFDNTGGRGPN